MWLVRTVEYLTIKRRETPTQATARMNLENMMLSERVQSQQAEDTMVSFIRYVLNRQIHRDRKWIRETKGWNREGWE